MITTIIYCTKYLCYVVCVIMYYGLYNGNTFIYTAVPLNTQINSNQNSTRTIQNSFFFFIISIRLKAFSIMECIQRGQIFVFAPIPVLSQPYMVFVLFIVGTLHDLNSKVEFLFLGLTFFLYNILYNPSNDTGLCHTKIKSKILYQKNVSTQPRTFSDYKWRIFIIFCRLAFLHYKHMYMALSTRR